MRRKLFLAVFIALIFPTSAIATTRAGTSIETQTILSFGETTVTIESVFTTVAQIHGVEISPVISAASAPGGESYNFPLRILNVGNSSERFFLSSSGSPDGWSTALYVDDNRNQSRDPGENTAVPASSILAEDADYLFFVEVDAPDSAFIGDHGYGVVVCSAETSDGPTYFGANGDPYGGDDIVVATCDVSIESLGNFHVWRNDSNGDIYLTWGGGYADVFYRTAFGLTFEGASSSKEATNVLSPWTSAAVHAKDSKTRFYRVAPTGGQIFAKYIGGKIDTPVIVGLNQLSIPLVPNETTLSCAVGRQAKGSTNAGDADRIWKYNSLTQSYYDIAWLVEGVGPAYDGMWYTGNYPTTLSIEADEGFVLQIRDGHPASYITFVGTVSATGRTVNINTDMTFFGTCFPIEVQLNDSNLWGSGATGGTNSTIADRVWSYNPNIQSFYDIAWLVDGTTSPYNGKWFTGNHPTSIKLKPGRGYWFQRRPGRAPFVWDYNKPY